MFPFCCHRPPAPTTFSEPSFVVSHSFCWSLPQAFGAARPLAPSVGWKKAIQKVQFHFTYNVLKKNRVAVVTNDLVATPWKRKLTENKSLVISLMKRKRLYMLLSSFSTRSMKQGPNYDVRYLRLNRTKRCSFFSRGVLRFHGYGRPASTAAGFVLFKLLLAWMVVRPFVYCWYFLMSLIRLGPIPRMIDCAVVRKKKVPWKRSFAPGKKKVAV